MDYDWAENDVSNNYINFGHDFKTVSKLYNKFEVQ